MKRHEQALLFLRKAAQDEALLDEVGDSANVSDEVFGFHCQQAAEKLLKAMLRRPGGRFVRLTIWECCRAVSRRRGRGRTNPSSTRPFERLHSP